MEIHEHPCETPGVALLSLDGGLDHSNTAPFVEQMDRLLEEGTARVVLDLARLTYISSWGLAALVRVHHHFALAGGHVAFAHLHGAAAAVLRVSHLDRFFDLYPTVEAALAAAAKRDGGQA